MKKFVKNKNYSIIPTDIMDSFETAKELKIYSALRKRYNYCKTVYGLEWCMVSIKDIEYTIGKTDEKTVNDTLSILNSLGYTETKNDDNYGLCVRFIKNDYGV